MNKRFQNALQLRPQSIPPIWMMRQAGRYHKHYQGLRQKHSFMELCKEPELAAEVALGPVLEFDFDVSILFSDLLFPLEAMNMGLEYTDHGPKLGWHLESAADVDRLFGFSEAKQGLDFQAQAVRCTRERLPDAKSLIGFVGGPWTLFSYACQGKHDGGLLDAKRKLPFFDAFWKKLEALLIYNIGIQLNAGAEVVMIFDTSAGEVSPALFSEQVLPKLTSLAAAFPGKLGYYSKGTTGFHLHALHALQLPWAGIGVDHRMDLATLLKQRHHKGFLQGNFDQALLFSERKDLEQHLKQFLMPLKDLSPDDRRGWVCGLGHGVLPKTPESHVKLFVDTVRRVFAD